VESIAPPFTQVYRSYTYAQNDCGAVQYSQSCPNTPYAGNGMIFSGWTGGLSGTADPATTTVHDEFLPLANFNIVPTVINATGVSPPLPVKTSAATLTVTGTDFVNGSFFAYWNNSDHSPECRRPVQPRRPTAASQQFHQH
jgi:hypothetical protein